LKLGERKKLTRAEMALEMFQPRKGAMAVFARQGLAVRRGSLLAHLAWRFLISLHGRMVLLWLCWSA
jgi:hypothetical protein